MEVGGMRGWRWHIFRDVLGLVDGCLDLLGAGVY
jgi:hypothetical protein